MAKVRRHRWLLLRVAAQNAGRQRVRAILLGLAVTLGVGVGFAGFIAGWALREGMTTSFSRMGADLVVVPRGSLVNITTSLLTVQPTDETLEAKLVTSLRAIPGIARAAPQRIVPVMVDGQAGNVVAFDPASDFSVTPWLEGHELGSLPVNGIIAGSRLKGRVGQWVSVCGKPLAIHRRLGNTGIGPFDESYFVSFDTLAEIAALCRSTPVALAEHADARACPSDLLPGRVSAVLLQLSASARASEVKFAVGQLPGVKVVEANTAVTSSRQAVTMLLVGAIVFTLVQLVALLILVSLLFSAIVQERHREVGLLRAMGARPDQVMTIILSEAAIITGIAGIAGLVFGVSLLLIFARSLGFYFGQLGIPFSWPPLSILESSAGAAVAVSAILGLAGASLPAWRVCRKAPYSLIQSETR